MTKDQPPAVEPPATAVGEALQRAEQGSADRPLTVKMTVDGGVEGERYVFDFEGDQHGVVHCQSHCEMSDRQVAAESFSVEPGEWIGALSAIRRADVAAGEPTAAGPSPIPPDSLIGRIEVTAEGETTTFVFMADEGQAADAAFEIDPAVLEAADRIYALAERHLGVPSLRP